MTYVNNLVGRKKEVGLESLEVACDVTIDYRQPQITEFRRRTRSDAAVPSQLHVLPSSESPKKADTYKQLV